MSISADLSGACLNAQAAEEVRVREHRKMLEQVSLLRDEQVKTLPC